LRSARMKTRWPVALPWAQRSEKRMNCMVKPQPVSGTAGALDAVPHRHQGKL
jgi:hypothetical protein